MIDTQIGPSDDIINVFGYETSLPVITEENELATSFKAHIVPAIATVLHAAASMYRVEVFNMSNGTGYVDSPITPAVVGSRPGDKMPVFVSWGFKYQRATVGKRSGGKRFGPIAESDVSDGTAVVGFRPTLDSLSSTLLSVLPIALLPTWNPCILERKPTGVFPWTSHPITNVIYEDVTTQNSRKR
jgi:hypothetical protein